MQSRQMTDREAYPAAWVTVAALALGFGVWKYVLGAPSVSGCWIWRHWGWYCPGCGGSRAVAALIRGQVLASFYYHPAVPVTAGVGAVYLLSQTMRRLRHGRGWALRYQPCWPAMLVGLLVANWAVRNVLWLGFGIPI